MKSKGFTLIELMILVAILGILASLIIPASGLFTLFPNYSDGERTGVIVKISHKGVIWKTWEGEMNIGSMSSNGPGVAVPTVFTFSVKDPVVVEEIRDAATSGTRTTVCYTQAFLRSRREGESQYLIYKVKH